MIELAKAKPGSLNYSTSGIGAAPHLAAELFKLMGFESGSEIGFFAPARTPAAIIARLHHEVVRVFSRPDVKARFLANSVEPVGSPPAQLAALLKLDAQKWSKVIHEAGIRVE